MTSGKASNCDDKHWQDTNCESSDADSHFQHLPSPASLFQQMALVSAAHRPGHWTQRKSDQLEQWALEQRKGC